MMALLWGFNKVTPGMVHLAKEVSLISFTHFYQKIILKGDFGEQDNFHSSQYATDL